MKDRAKANKEAALDSLMGYGKHVVHEPTGISGYSIEDVKQKLEELPPQGFEVYWAETEYFSITRTK